MEPVDQEAPRPPKRGNRIALLAVLALTLISVGAVLYDAFAPTTEEPLDKRSHAAIVRACDGVYHQLKALPPLTNRTNRAELAARTQQENGIFATLLTAFDRVSPTDSDGRTAFRKWTADWRAVMQRRADYVTRLQTTTKHADFVIPADERRAPVTDRMNQYSRTHQLLQCLTGTLQLETVDTIRQYPRTDTVTG